MIVGCQTEARALTIMDYRQVSSTIMGRLIRALYHTHIRYFLKPAYHDHWC